ncbi:hypothetical protein QYE76_051795 [Lolium multiflorum]|uniref:DNA-binding protein RHL1 n=1 Tax=Lolium multiflorum TaxID=4521 RepID=A0AAD8SU30_LOLMU|nr:hypothetical protein QYE76_051795 [Lolium multiflorum]
MAKKPAVAASTAGDPEAEERRRLRSLAVSNGLLQRGEPAAPRAALPTSGAVTRLQGRDIVRRGHRKSRFLFSFPGLLAPAASGGRIGELADLGTKNPILYLEFPHGRMKLLGTHVYPKNKYLTLQMTKSVKGVACEDVFESMIVFSEAWWIGTKEENPEELKLDFPEDIQKDGAAEDFDFKGGAGAASGEVITANKPGKQTREHGKEIKEPLTPEDESDADSFDSDRMDENGTQTTSETPVRKSARTAGKDYKYSELLDGGDSTDSDNEIEGTEDLDEKIKSPEIKEEIPSEDFKPEDSSAQSLPIKKEPLVQATLSTMFKKAEEKKRSTSSPKGSPATKGPVAKKQRAIPKEKQSVVQKEASASRKKQKPKVEDEVQEISDCSEDENMDDDDDGDDSDEDWAE